MTSISFQSKYLAFGIISALTLAGCTTVLDEGPQRVAFEVRGAEKARCIVQNDDFKYIIDLPTEDARLERSPDDLKARCTGGDHREISLIIPARSNWPQGEAVNLLEGTLPGIETDPLNGPFYSYPDRVIVDFDVRDGYIANDINEDMVQPSGQKGQDIFTSTYVPRQKATMPSSAEPQTVEPNLSPSPKRVEDWEGKPRSAMEMLHEQYNTPSQSRVKVETQVQPQTQGQATPVIPAIPMIAPATQNFQMQPIIDEPPVRLKAVTPKPESASVTSPLKAAETSQPPQQESKKEQQPQAEDVLTIVDPDTVMINDANVSLESDYSPDNNDLVMPTPMLNQSDVERVQDPNQLDSLDENIMQDIENEAVQDMFDSQMNSGDGNSNRGGFE